MVLVVASASSTSMTSHPVKSPFGRDYDAQLDYAPARPDLSEPARPLLEITAAGNNQAWPQATVCPPACSAPG